MTRPGTLIGLHYSPWTEKARWALDVAAIEYRFVPHVPMLGELGLRMRARRWSGRASAPLYRADELTLTDSFDIARHASETARGAGLFPAGSIEIIRAWNERSERALAAGRKRTLERAMRDPAALVASVRASSPLSLGPLDAWLGAMGTRHVLRKYQDLAPDPEAAEAEQRAVLTAVRDGLRGREYLLGTFSYADIVAAVTLAFVTPRAEAFGAKAAPLRRVWSDAALAREFADLVEWRDMLYARHRGAMTLGRSERTQC